MGGIHVYEFAMALNINGGNRRSTQRDTTSPYAAWFNPDDLRREADRLTQLPQATPNIMRWRRQRLRAIGRRLSEIYNTR